MDPPPPIKTDKPDHKFKMVCGKCDVQWRSPLPKDNCWSCGQTVVQWQ